jgi:hypothetical protein
MIFVADGAWGVLDATGQRQHGAERPTANFKFKGYQESFLLAPDGATVQFDYGLSGKSPARFGVRDRTLTLTPTPDRTLIASFLGQSGTYASSIAKATLCGRKLPLEWRLM